MSIRLIMAASLAVTRRARLQHHLARWPKGKDAP